MKLCIKTTNKFTLAKSLVRQIFSCKEKVLVEKQNTKESTAVQLELQADFTNKIETGEQQAKALEEETAVKKVSEQEQVSEAGQQVAKQKSKKTKITSAIFFLLNIAIVVGILLYQLSNEEVVSIDYLFSQGTRLWYIVLILGCFAIIMFLDALRTNMFMKRSGSRSRPFLSYKTCVTGKYYDAVTPLSTGGQPFQVFYLNNRGLSASAAISVPMARYVVSQLGWISISIFAVIFALNFSITDTSVISVASYVGFALNATVLTFTLVLSLSKKLGKKLVVKTLKLLQKMRIVKNYEKQYERVMKVVSGYQGTMSEYAKDIGFFIIIILISVLINIIHYSIPFFIYLMFGGTNVALWPNMLVLAVMIELAASFIPLPGGTGMNEISFTVMFAPYFTGGTIFWALLLWRFMSYYIYLLQGIGVIIYDYAIGNKKYNWQKRKWELEAESKLFREQQIKNYKKQKKQGKKASKV